MAAKTPLQKAIQDLFALMDADGDGTIVESEAHEVAKCFGFNPQTFWKVLIKFDEDGDRKLVLGEFEAAMNKGFREIMGSSGEEMLTEIKTAIGKLDLYRRGKSDSR